MKASLLALLVAASPAMAAPRIDALTAKGDPKSPDVQFTIAVSKSGGNCDVRLEFGDGSGRTVDFGLATTRSLHYTYRKGGSYKATARGTGKTPCEGTREVAVTVTGPAEKKAEPKKAEKKAEKKKAEKKKAGKKPAPAKKEEPKA